MNNIEKFLKLGRMPNTHEMRELSGVEVREIDRKLSEQSWPELIKTMEESAKDGILIDIS